MASRAKQTKPTASELADLSALADGTLDPARRAGVEAHIAATPELGALYERERRVVAALHQARASDRAPERLRARIEATRGNRPALVRRRVVYGGGLAVALAAVALTLVLALPGGAPGAPSVSDAAALAARGPMQGPPAPDPASPQSLLNQSVGAIQFPNWTMQFGWRAVGTRCDKLGGHRAVTVYYRARGKRVAYTIVPGPLSAEPTANEMVVHGTTLWTSNIGGRRVVTWREGDATCVLSGNGVSASQLRKLAAWSDPTAVR